MPHLHRLSIWLSYGMGAVFSLLILLDIDASSLIGDEGPRELEVSLLGRDVGSARDREYLDIVLELLLPSVGPQSRQAVDWVVAEPAPVQENIFAGHRRLRKGLEELLATHEAGFAVSVNGRPVVTLATIGEARGVLDDLIARFSPRAAEGEIITEVNVRTRERLAVEPSLAPPAAVMSVPEAVSFLLAGTRERRIYRVKAGDVLGAIAARHSMTVEEVLKANPGLVANRIREGEILNLVVPQPLVTVETRYVRVYRRPIPFAVSVTWDPELYRTERRVDRPGRRGEEELTEEVVRLNGETASRTVLKRVVLRQPETQFVTAGTRRTPEDLLGDVVAEGGVAALTSPFGRRGNRQHTGVDWAMPIGTPIRAWRDGKVRFAAYVVGYGRLVILEHPEGQLSYYAHLSRIAVSLGDYVTAGEIIAYSGNTGNTTGPHLHFEIREDGRPVDPLVVLRGEQPAVGGP